MSDCARWLAAADDALEHQDSEALEIVAHAMGGSADYFHGPAAYRAALTLEMLARARDFTHAHEACSRLLHAAISQHTPSTQNELRHYVP